MPQHVVLEKSQTGNFLNNAEKFKLLDVQTSKLKTFQEMTYFENNWNIYNKLLG